MALDRKQISRWDIPFFSHYIAVPRIATEELDLYERAVYVQYISDITWAGGEHIEGGRSFSERCGVSINKFYEVRRSLHDKGYLVLMLDPTPDKPDIVELSVNIWKRNAEKYASTEARVQTALDTLEGIMESIGIAPDYIERIKILASRIRVRLTRIRVTRVTDSSQTLI